MYLRKGFRHSFCVYSLVLALISIPQLYNPLKPNLQGEAWSVPQKIPLYQSDTTPPILLADKNQTVHAFSSQWIDLASANQPVQAIFYNQWTVERGWTKPVDIIIAPYMEARLTAAYLDKDGIIHVIFWGGDNIVADIYYTRAPAAQAGTASAWSPPLLIGRVAGELDSAAFAENDQGILSVLYYGRAVKNGLYAVSSSDDGETWSAPAAVFFTKYEEPNIAQIHMARGSSGDLHATWGVYTTNGTGRGIYYSRSEDGSQWSEPVLLANAQEGLGTQKPGIVGYDGTLFSLYIMPPNKITMRYSEDDGKTWSDPTLIFPRHEGVNGEMSLVVDGNNRLHLFFGQRIRGSPDIHGMWHSMFINKRWTEPEAIIKGPRVQDLSGDKGFDPNFARAVVSQGNTILVTWMTDPAAGFNGVWYAYQQIDAPKNPANGSPPPEDPVVNPSTGSDVPMASAGITATPSISSQKTDVATQVPMNRPFFSSNPSMPLIVGSFSAIILILVAIAFGSDRNK